MMSEDDLLARIGHLEAELAKCDSVALAEEIERLRAANADLERFVQMAAHDLHGPVRAVASFAQLLDEECAGTLSDSAAEYMDFVRDGAVRLQALIRDVGSYGRIGRGGDARGPCDLGAIVGEILDSVAADVEMAGVEVTVGRLPVVDGYASDLEQIFRQLIDNAVRYREEIDPCVRIFASAEDEHWVISVEDNGIGIETEHRDQVFEAFRRLHGRSEVEGHGLGLAIARRAARGHGGTLSVESEKGQGSVFQVWLPASSPGIG